MYAMAYKLDFSEWLESVMREQGVSQSELARMSGVTRSAINGILRGARGPGVDLCNGIARALKIPPEEVLRAAGLLPTEQPQDENLYKIEHLYHTLKDKSNRERALQFLQFLSDLEDKDDRKGKKPK